MGINCRLDQDQDRVGLQVVKATATLALMVASVGFYSI